MAHKPVMLDEVIKALHIMPDGIYVDATFGRGGHTAAILRNLGNGGRLYAIDLDPEAVTAARHMINDQRFFIRHGSFAALGQFCDDWGISGRVSGLLLDLGVSSPQLDNPARGFSFMHDGPLDMRMNIDAGQSAQTWLQQAEEAEIAEVLWKYGEERLARRIARQVVAARSQSPLVSTGQLAEIIGSVYPRNERHKNPATRSFQAIRIFINQELENLQAVLDQSVQLLSAGGRLAVISFHSLEDRIVKRFMRLQSVGRELPRHLPVMQSRQGQTMRLIGKAMKPEESEIQGNPRARSAVLRVAEKLH
ncbi:MAG TPA: 16S rRNA (cytosine(1402)-N(4))-methyltransferase RsmH [Gammaproteobacteria bacterium]